MFRFFSMSVILAVFVVLAALPEADSAQHPFIRVAVMKGVPSATVKAARGLVTVKGAGGANIVSGVDVKFRSQNGIIRINGNPIAGEYVVVTARPALYYVDRRKFRGSLRIYPHEEDSLLIVNELDLEDYLAGLINSEISSNWPIEAVKAQAVAARTYALNQIGGTNRYSPDARYDVEATVADQVYHGAHREDKRAYEGVRATTGVVLTRGGVIFPSFYHSTCGGYTESAHNVWDNMKDSPTVVDEYCKRSPYRAWFFEMTREEMLALLTGANIISRDEILMRIGQIPLANSPRVDEVVVVTDKGEHRIKATQLRRMIGYKRLKSTWFNVGIEGNRIVFAGRGFGHGVGLCQWGAKGMADAGYTYKDILKHYYSDAEIGRMY
jgi:stage II sporulation protein D